MKKKFNKLDKGKYYCKHCFMKGKISELKYNEQEKLVNLCKIHNNLRGNFHILVFSEKYNDFVDVRGRNPFKRPEIEKAKASDTPGFCSIEGCGRYNKERDQNGRGRDIGYGYGEWIADHNIIDKDSGKIIVYKGQKCGCNCSQKFYQKHNRSNKMRVISKKSMKKLIERDDITYECPKCGFGKSSYLLTCPKCRYDPHIDFEFTCKNCGCKIPNPNATCDNCGFKDERHFYCKNCKHEIKNPMSKCENCGYQIENNLKNYIKKYEEKYCKICNCKTLHNEKSECLVCKGTHIWCGHCQQWETPSFNSRPNHWMFWAAETKQWMNDNPNKVALAKEIIIGLNHLLSSSAITGVYGWFINGKSVYVGESTDILTRSLNHIMYIFEEPDYWYNVVNYFSKNKIEVKILEFVDRNDPKYINLSDKEFKNQVLKPLELKWITKLHPDSQKCDGTDHIRSIRERQLIINI